MDKPAKEVFKAYHLVYERQYDLNSEEALKRYKNFKANLEYIKKRNSENLSFKLGFNDFSDLSPEEYREKYVKGRVIVKGEELQKFMKVNDKFLSKQDDDNEDLLKRNLSGRNPIDWSRYLLGARNQGYCGSCWAHAITANVEACLAVKNRNPNQYLSVQQMVDCDKTNNGCDGGSSLNAFNYVKTYGLMAENEYPYQESVQYCRYNSNRIVARVTGFTYCSNYGWDNKCSVDKIYNILSKGPASVGIDGSTQDFMNYQYGILDTYCYSDNHAVLLVGYGVEGGREYWLIRNSHGASWGINGYVKVANNDYNQNSCFVTNEAYQFTC